MLKRILTMIPVVLTAYAISSAVAKVAAEPQQNQPSASSAQHEHDQPSQASMSDMMTMHQQMMVQMNAATGDAKTSALADVVNELARQQKSMHERMGTMHDQMMMGGRGMMMKQP